MKRMTTLEQTTRFGYPAYCVAALVMSGALTAVGCGGDPATPADREPATGAAQTTAGGAPALPVTDVQFMQQAAKGGHAEVELAQMAQDKASSEEVKSMARIIEDDHEQANQQLQQLAEQHDVDLDDSLSPQHQQLQERLEELEGAAFDKAYRNAMVEEHRKDISAFMQASSTATGDVRAFAERTLPVLRKHLEHAESGSSSPTAGGQ